MSYLLEELLYSDSIRQTLMDQLRDRFEDNQDGTVTDNMRNRMWLQDAGSNFKFTTWNDAIKIVKKLKTAGYNDWRLPTRKELESLVGIRRIKSPFKNIVTEIYYWSSDTYMIPEGNAWRIRIDNGDVDYNYKTEINFIWPVRSIK